MPRRKSTGVTSTMDSATPIGLGSKLAYYIYASVILLCSSAALYAETWAIAAVPLVLIGAVLVIKDVRILYYGFFALLPFSIEVEVGPLGTDLPSEPMMLALTGVGILLFAQHFRSISSRYLTHPITMLLLLHLSWILVTSIFSLTPVYSFKFLVAKIWYIIPFYFLGFYMLRSHTDCHRLFKMIGIFLTIAVCIVLTRHAMLGFTFDTSNTVVYPIFRNHVSYAAIIVTILPYMWVLWVTERKKWQLLAIAILVIGTYFSYTRAAHLCIFIMLGAYFVFKYNYGKLAISASLALGILFSCYMVSNNNFLRFAPDFDKTITHDNFENLVEATYKLEDISTMERVYRWVAGGYMIGRRPVLGVGPGGFYHNYTKHTVTSFETYVSDNPEKSGIHCYYLMVWVEQGTPGFLIFMALCIVLLIYGERTFRASTAIADRRIIIAATLSTVSICALCLINDLIETDKVGPFFFINAAIIVLYDLKNRKVNTTKQL